LLVFAILTKRAKPDPRWTKRKDCELSKAEGLSNFELRTVESETRVEVINKIEDVESK
jgi:hypothetical protein